MEKLIIRKFLNLENIEVEFKDITLFIGKEGSGKSLISKLHYFIGKIPKLIMEGIRFQTGIYAYVQFTFDGLFFTEIKDAEVLLQTHKSEYDIELKIKENKIKEIRLGKRLNKEIDDYKKDVKSIEKTDNYPRETFLLQENVLLRLSHYSKIFYKSVYIPSHRTSVRIGQVYEGADEITQQYAQYLYIISRGTFLNTAFSSIIKKFTGGAIYKGENTLFFIKNNLKIPLYAASSGEKELIYLLISLIYHYTRKDKNLITVYIEEPESHIHPNTQYELVKLMAQLKNNSGTKFIIETHSPYILSSFNNLLYAHDVYKSANEEQRKKIAERIKIDEQIDPEVLTCYSTDKKSVIMENNLILADEIDSVSDKILEEFNVLAQFDHTTHTL